MIHNKYHEILSQYLGDYNKEIYGRELINKVSLSQKGIALALKELKNEAILISKKKGNMKFYSLNLRNQGIKDIIKVTEIERKTKFLKKNPRIGQITKSDNRIAGIFGSFAKGTQKKDSDIDMFIIGNKKEKDYDKNMYDLNISIKYFSNTEFKTLLNNKNNLMKEIVQNHILLFNTEEFIDTIWREFYGND